MIAIISIWDFNNLKICFLVFLSPSSKMPGNNFSYVTTTFSLVLPNSSFTHHSKIYATIYEILIRDLTRKMMIELRLYSLFLWQLRNALNWEYRDVKSDTLLGYTVNVIRPLYWMSRIQQAACLYLRVMLLLLLLFQSKLEGIFHGSNSRHVTQVLHVVGTRKIHLQHTKS